MSAQHTYDPEDLESLLSHKSFEELYPEERAFVLRHISGPEEYNSLRKTLSVMNQLSSNNDDWLEPDPRIREQLLTEFASERRNNFRIWLNSLFVKPFRTDWQWYRRPGIQVAFSLVLLVGLFFFLNQQKPEQFAELRKEEVNTPAPPAGSEESAETPVSPEQETILAENKVFGEPAPSLPLAPEPVVAAIQEMDVVSEDVPVEIPAEEPKAAASESISYNDADVDMAAPSAPTLAEKNMTEETKTVMFSDASVKTTAGSTLETLAMEQTEVTLSESNVNKSRKALSSDARNLKPLRSVLFTAK